MNLSMLIFYDLSESNLKCYFLLKLFLIGNILLEALFRNNYFDYLILKGINIILIKNNF